LGLSASIVTKKCDLRKFVAEKERLERALDSTVVTTENIQELLM
jgi:hypothetical protein